LQLTGIQDAPDDLERQSFVCHLSLFDSDTEEDRTIIRKSDDTQLFQNLVGQRVSSGTILSDPEDGIKKLFFLFPDLSIRIIGEYRFVCNLINLSR
jgi:hypothetical protein